MAAAPRFPQITTDGTGIYQHDAAIGDFGGHLHYRWSQYCEKRGQIDEFEGGLEKFSRGTHPSPAPSRTVPPQEPSVVPSLAPSTASRAPHGLGKTW